MFFYGSAASAFLLLRHRRLTQVMHRHTGEKEIVDKANVLRPNGHKRADRTDPRYIHLPYISYIYIYIYIYIKLYNHMCMPVI